METRFLGKRAICYSAYETPWLLLAVVCSALVGCASAGVSHSNLDTATHLDRPSIIYLAPTNVTSGQWKIEDVNAKAKYQTDVQNWFAELLPDHLKEIAPSQAYSGSQTSGWLVTTKVLYFEPGDAALRLWIGGGAGKSKIRTEVTVYDLARSTSQPIVDFEVDGDSGNASTLYEQSTIGTGPKRDVWRSTRAIRDYLMLAIGHSGGHSP